MQEAPEGREGTGQGTVKDSLILSLAPTLPPFRAQTSPCGGPGHWLEGDPTWPPVCSQVLLVSVPTAEGPDWLELREAHPCGPSIHRCTSSPGVCRAAGHLPG